MVSDPALTPELLLQAYRVGVFPMSESRTDPEVFWVDPKYRGIIPIGGFHISRSLRKRLLRDTYRVTFNTAFADVVRGCADRPETWINSTIFDLYAQLHGTSDAYSIEVWEDDTLVGGVYGVAINAAFFGESMFSTATDASKVALAYLIDVLGRAGFSLFDTQFVTPHLSTMGGVEIARTDYHKMLKQALNTPARALSTMQVASVQDLIQRNTQTS